MKKYVKWFEVKQYIDNLVERLKNDEYFHLEECPGIFTFPRGGFILATLLSYKLDLPILSNPVKNCIIIDDIIDTGITMKKYSDLVNDKNYFITAMFMKDNQLEEEAEYQCFADYFEFVKKDEWIVYPWEDMSQW
nr:phosphoribosyl transferase [Caudoviricetes sp.]